MRVKIMLQITTDDDAPGGIEEIASFGKSVERAEDLGLSLAESKTLLAAAQQRIVETQTKGWTEGRRCCEACGAEAKQGQLSDPISHVVWRRAFGESAISSLSMPRGERKRHGVAAHGTHPRPRCAGAALSGDALGLARSLCARGRTPGCPAVEAMRNGSGRDRKQLCSSPRRSRHLCSRNRNCEPVGDRRVDIDVGPRSTH